MSLWVVANVQDIVGVNRKRGADAWFEIVEAPTAGDALKAVTQRVEDPHWVWPLGERTSVSLLLIAIIGDNKKEA